MGKLQIKSAARRSKNLHDASSWHCTTFESGDVRPTYYRPLLATDRIQANISNQVRLSPLEVPTFGDFKLRHSAYFVPYNTVWRYYDDFKRNNRSALFSIDSNFPALSGWSDAEFTKPRVNREMFVAALEYRGYFEKIGSPSGSLPQLAAGSDFIYSFFDGFDSLFYQAKFTAKGRKLKAILDALGYRFPWSSNIHYIYGSSTNFHQQAEFLDLLPLLQYARVFYDHIYDSHFLDDLDFSYFTDSSIWCELNYIFEVYCEQWFDGTLPIWEPAADDPFYPTSRGVNAVAQLADFIDKVVEISTSWWSHSIFTDGWLSPNSRNGQTIGASETLTGPDWNTKVENKNFAVTGDQSEFNISSWMLRAVQNLADFATRYNIGGARLHDWLQQNFGVVTRMQDADMSIFIRTLTQNVTIQDVTQTSESTDNSLLGEQAGKGYSFGSNGFSYECDRDGAVIVITELVPEIHYVEGSAYWTSDSPHPSWLNLYQPAFDNLGFVPLPLREVKADYLRPVSWQKTNNVFRYVPSYAQHKVRYDVLSGMFTLASQNAGLGSDAVPAGQLGCYHSGRIFPENWNQDRGLSFNKQDQQMDRVFALAPTDAQGRQIYDHFYCLFQFNVKRWSSMKTIGESIPFFDRAGDTITVDYNGNI